MKSSLPDSKTIASLPADGGPEYNRLIHEKSPYLLQHATNPVDWYPWGEAAFKAAESQDKPIFLSVGYATCHWCHVMEHESFEDPAIAELLNRHFICIKVDREERPDIDHVYMMVTQAITGSGGWPMTVFLTPKRKPFYAGTYFPPTGRFGRPGMQELIPNIGTLWITKKEELLRDSEQLVNQLQRYADKGSQGSLNPEIDVAAFRQLSSRYDAVNGGFGDAPKFPAPHQLSFLLRYWYRTGNSHALEMVEKTLKEMRYGGLYDHIGFGFHRYSTDSRWLVPHFEKMLYDQALLTIAYTETWQATGDSFYQSVAEEILEYVLRDMTAPEGGFYSAEDADSEGEEGIFYLWSTEELRQELGAVDAGLFEALFNCRPEGNYQDESTGKKTQRNIIHLKNSILEYARVSDLDPDKLTHKVASMRAKLFNRRKDRIHPLKDDKVLTDWNGLMIAAMAKAGRVFEKLRYTQAAENAATFVLNTLRRPEDGRLIKRYRDGEAAMPAHLDDYAFFVWGLLELYETTFNEEWLEAAISLTDEMIERFFDKRSGGFYMTAEDGETLLIRDKALYDGAMPSGNSIATLNLLKLYHILGKLEYQQVAQQTINFFAHSLEQMPSAYAQMLQAVDFGRGPTREFVVAGARDSEETRDLLKIIRKVFMPNKVVILRPEPEETPRISDLAAYTLLQRAVGGKASVYLCQEFACQLPITDPDKLNSALSSSQ